MIESPGTSSLKAPFPWFGGKRRVAAEVWAAMGEVDNFVEPFAGSLAVLLARPDDRWQTGAETVNDADAYLCNFWRALAAAPDEVAHWADWPVNETDLLARHLWLVDTGKKRIASMEADPDFYDAKVAGWWVWGINSWIGSGWCHGNGPWWVRNGEVVNTGDRGVQWRQCPHLGDAGRGVNRKLPKMGNGTQHNCLMASSPLLDYFSKLSVRLRRVRVCCGDWSRVVTDGVMAFGDSVGVFLDPPYLGDVRSADLYRVEDYTLSNEVREWALAHGDDKRLRIVLAGYEEEHAAKMPNSWRVHAYSANASYQRANGSGGNRERRHNERLWFSPWCDQSDTPLFGKGAATS